MLATDPRFRSRLILCFAIVYVVWGSSYLANAIGVRHLPPMLFAGVRFVLGGLALSLLARRRGLRATVTAADWRQIAVVAFLAVMVSNGFNAWALQWVPSGQAALLNVSSSFWIPVFGLLGARAHAIGLRAGLGLAVGLAGTLLILTPRASVGADPVPLIPQLGILVGCMGWAGGTIYLRNATTRLDLLSFTGLQMLVGGVMLCAGGLAVGEAARWNWSVPGLAAMLYLTVFSSCIAYTAYAWLTQHTAPARVATYAYVNPALATLLGWLVLDEQLTALTFAGMAIVIAGVALINWPARRRP